MERCCDLNKFAPRYMESYLRFLIISLIFAVFCSIIVNADEKEKSAIVWLNESHTAQKEKKSDEQKFQATAYCETGKGCIKGRYNGITKSGIKVRRGIIAVDPKVIKLGTLVEIIEPKNYAGIYLAADTGSAVRGKIIDIWMPSYKEAISFGRRKVLIKIVGKDGFKKEEVKSEDIAIR